MLSFYEGGQACGETGDHRKTTVIYECCPPLDTTATILGVDQHTEFMTSVYIRKVAETATCQYEMSICVPQLCLPSERPAPTTVQSTTPTTPSDGTSTTTIATPPAGGKGAPMNVAIDNLSHIIKTLVKNPCLYRHEDWWM